MGNFNKIFRELRLKYGYTQDGLAAAIGMSRSAVSMYETGNREPDIETLEKIADYFNIDMDHLLGRTPSTDTPDSVNEPTFTTVERLIARNGNNLTTDEKLHLIKLLTEYIKED